MVEVALLIDSICLDIHDYLFICFQYNWLFAALSINFVQITTTVFTRPKSVYSSNPGIKALTQVKTAWFHSHAMITFTGDN